MPLNHKYFTIEELVFSEKACEKRIRNKTTKAIEENLDRLIVELLDPIRERWGKPLTVSSGYRCPMLNSMVGGSRTSAHMSGLAADLRAGNPSKNRELAKLIIKSGLKFDQIIDEYGFQWVHVGLCTRDRIPRGEILRTKDGIDYTSLTAEQL